MRVATRFLIHLPVAVFALAVLPSCGKDKSPTAGTPSPVPTAAPTPTPSPTPSLPGMASCTRIGLGRDGGNLCDRRGSTFEGDVVQAIRELQSEQPQIFEDSPGGVIVRSPGQFYVGIIEKLDKKGLCGGFDSEELQVKASNEFNDQYALRTSRGFLRTDPSIYRATCFPAAFPTPLPPFFPPNPGCNLAPSLELTCSRETSLYYNDIERSIDDVMRTRPELFDPSIPSPGNANWPLVKDFHAYHEAIAQSMIAKGYCARFDGEEIAVKKENRFNEQFDVFLGEGFVRRGEGIYRSTCWPSAF
jgi:hypothetical protein